MSGCRMDGMCGWLQVKVNQGPCLATWTLLRNGIIFLYSEPHEERPRHVFALQSATVSRPSSDRLTVKYLSPGNHLTLDFKGEPNQLQEWQKCIISYISEWKSKRRLSILYQNRRMRFAVTTNLDPVSEDGHDLSNCTAQVALKELVRCPVTERTEGCHQLRTLALVPEEERSLWANLPQVTAVNITDRLSEGEIQSNELLLSLVLDEVVYNQELCRLVDLARASVRWKDSLPLFNRRSIIGCSLRVKKCSDSLVQGLEQAWVEPQGLATDLGRTFHILESSLDAATAQTYIAYCDNLDDARTLFRRATQRDSGLMSCVVSSRCHIECALLPLYRLGQLRTVLERISRNLPAAQCSQQLLQCQQLYVTVSGIIELCYKVLTSLHSASYVADIESMLEFSNKLSTLRVKHIKREGCDISKRPPLPLPQDMDPSPAGDTVMEESFNLIDLKSMENLVAECQVDSPSSSESRFSSGSSESVPGVDYELIEMKELTARRWSGDCLLLQKSFEEQPLYQAYNKIGKTVPDLDSPIQSKSIFYAYLDVAEDMTESVKNNCLQPLRTLWRETDEVEKSGLLDNLTPSQIALQESKFEVLTSEVSYLKSLNILITLFVESAELKGVLGSEDRRSLFSNILEVRKASEMFLFDLAGQWEEDLMLPDICGVINKHAQGTFRVYVEYCSNQVPFHRTLQRLMLDGERFVPAMSALEAQPECQGYSLQSFLMLPVQRVTRLPLLIQAIQRRVHVGTPEFANCKTALTAVNQLVHECNEGVRSIEQAEKVEVLSQILEAGDKAMDENKINSTSPKKTKKVKSSKKRHSALPWRIFSSSSPAACDR